MDVDFNIKVHFHTGGKFQRIGKKTHYVGEIGCHSIDCSYDKFSMFELRGLLKQDCKYEGEVTELWCMSPKVDNVIRMIITDKELIDMSPTLRKCNVVHLYVIEDSVGSLTLPLVTHNFVDQNLAINQTKDHSKPPLGPITKPRITRSTTSRRIGDHSTPADGSMAPTGKNSEKQRYLAPGSLRRGLLPNIRIPNRPTSLVAQNPSERTPSHALGYNVHDGTTKEYNVHDKMQLPSWFVRDIVLQANNKNGERCEKSPDNGSRETERSVVGGIGSTDGISGQSSKRKRSSGTEHPRGRNKVREVATLKSGQKLKVEFYNNGPVGANQKALSRHIGKLVRDRDMLPITVHSWSEIDSKFLDKLWDAIVDNFEGDDFENRRKIIMCQARTAWNKWRGEMKQLHLKDLSNLEDALKLENVPLGLLEEDWKWLVEEHYTDPDFMIKSVRNSENRAELNNPSHTGSKPIRQFIYDDLGGKHGKVPTIDEIFRETRKQKNGTLDEKDAATYDKIVEESTKNPSLSQFELVEKCFGPQDRDRVTCFGFGMKPKDMRGPEPSKADLKNQLQEKNQLISELTNRVEKIGERNTSYQQEINEIQAAYQREVVGLHDEVKMLKELFLKQQANNATPSSFFFWSSCFFSKTWIIFGDLFG